jgi:ElaB/YqjD/DUF883 family membrane-anchored ribosome-binding protein
MLACAEAWLLQSLWFRSHGGVDSMPDNNPQQATPQQQLSRAADGVNKAFERAEQSAEDITSTALHKVRQVRQDAQSGLEQQRDELAGRIRRVGDALRATSDTLQAQDAVAQQLFDAASEQIERVAGYVGTVTPGELASDLQSLARRRPGLFFGSSFVLGLALGRFAKSSASGASSASAEDEHVRRAATRPRSPSRSATYAERSPASASPSRPSNTTHAGTSSLPQGVSSTVHSTEHTQPSTAPSYGATSGTVAKPQAEPSPATTKAHSVEPGEGVKS